MTIYLPEVRKISLDFMSLPVFNPNVFSEDEDDLPGMNTSLQVCLINNKAIAGLEGKEWESLQMA
jgi:hypothetical protein